jgi:hypothetical protein
VCVLESLKGLGASRVWRVSGVFHVALAVPRTNKGCVALWPCSFTLKSTLRQKKNYGNSNISPCKNIIFKKTL